MKTITIDIETASDENIKESGVYRYAESENFELLLVSYSIDNGPVATCDIANGETLPEEVLKALTDKSVIKKAFNVNFERVCLSVYLRRNYPEIASFEDAVGNYIDPESWQCDMIHSRYLGMMSSLDDMGRLLRLKEKKMSEGKDLIKFFCTLHEDKNGNLFFHDKSDAPTKWKTFKEYNRRDVEVEMKIQHLLSEVPVPDFIWEEFYIDQRINDRGILVDTAFAAKAVELDNNVKKELFPKLSPRRADASPFADVIASLASMGYDKRLVEQKILELSEVLAADSSFSAKTQKEKEDFIFRKAIIELS